MASSGVRRFCRAASHAAGSVFHQAIVSGCVLAPASVSRFAVNPLTIVLSGRNAAEPMLSIE